jgi:hypothetical protein
MTPAFTECEEQRFRAYIEECDFKATVLDRTAQANEFGAAGSGRSKGRVRRHPKVLLFSLGQALRVAASATRAQ